ncbi:ROK family protein [soil metagenome]
MSNSSLLLGIDIGGTKSAVIIGTSAGEVVSRREFPSRTERGPMAMIGDLLAAAGELLKLHPGVVSAGVSIGGPVNVANGVVLSPPNLPGWDSIPLRQILTQALNLPVHIEHDAAACAKAEYLWGGGQNCARVCYLTCGTGFGMGLVIDGKTYYGGDGASPEIGHVRYRLKGPEAFGKIGSYEAYGAGASLGKLAMWAFPKRWNTIVPGEELARLARDGDADAQHVIGLNARAVGDACALLADIVCPDVILLGSLARYLGDGWLIQVKNAFANEIRGTTRPTRIVPAELGSRLQDCSAMAAAF